MAEQGEGDMQARVIDALRTYKQAFQLLLSFPWVVATTRYIDVCCLHVKPTAHMEST